MTVIRTTKRLKLDTIQTHPRNANHGDAGAISISLTELGQYRAIVVSEATGNILAGNHTYLAAQMNGATTMLAHLIPDLTADDEIRIMVADNQYARLAYTDDIQLAELLTELVGTDVGLAATGFDTDDLDLLLQDLLRDDPGREGELSEPPADPTTKLGDRWQLGVHMLVCGDALTRPIADLVTGDGYDLLLTDPPWGVSNKGTGGRSVEGDTTTAAIPLLFTLYVDALEGWLYVFAGSNAAGLIGKLWDVHLHATPAIAVWNKGEGHAVMAQNGYHYQWEPIWYGFTKGTGHNWYGSRTFNEASDVFTYHVPTQSERTHPTQKPVELLERPINNSCPPGGTVIDPFAGSGSTLIAADNLNRICHTIEIDPAYCDVIIKRWESLNPDNHAHLMEG